MRKLSARDQADFWRNEARLCSKDRMYGCAAVALSEYLRLNPEADNEASRAQITQWQALGNVAANESYSERAARALDEEWARKERRFAVLTSPSRTARRGGLTPKEQDELFALAAELDARASGSPTHGCSR